MSITDELRACARTFLGVWVDGASQTITFTTSDVPPTVDSIRMDSRLLAIADRIDAAHEEAIASVMNDALYHANEKDMGELGWMRLPKDADGEYIHIGDELDDGLRRAFAPKKVKMLMLEDDEWALNFGGGWCSLKNHEWRHHKQPTVEDLLRDYASLILLADCRDDEDALVAEYASKFRLAGDAE